MANYTLIRTNRKTLALEVGIRREVIVRAPLKTPLSEIERFVSSHADWIEKRLSARPPEPTNEQRDACVRRAMATLPDLVEKYARMLGVRPTGITITGAEKRFGSCSPQNRLCFSWRLMLYPDEAIEYVVVHELAHILNKNHGPDFYACIASVMPDHARRRKLLG